MPTMSLATSKRHFTNAGRIVYNRTATPFHVRDVVRILRRLEPMGNEVLRMIEMQLEVSQLWLRFIRNATAFLFANPSQSFDIASSIRNLVDQVLVSLRVVSEKGFNWLLDELQGIVDSYRK